MNILFKIVFKNVELKKTSSKGHAHRVPLPHTSSLIPTCTTTLADTIFVILYLILIQAGVNIP